MGEIHNTQFFKAVQENKMDVSQIYYVRRPDLYYQP